MNVGITEIDTPAHMTTFKELSQDDRELLVIGIRERRDVSKAVIEKAKSKIHLVSEQDIRNKLEKEIERGEKKVEKLLKDVQMLEKIVENIKCLEIEAGTFTMQ